VTLPSETVEEFLARCRRERVEAGLPERVNDPAVLDQIASLVAATTEND
jgi:hypothetical protein